MDPTPPITRYDFARRVEALAKRRLSPYWRRWVWVTGGWLPHWLRDPAWQPPAELCDELRRGEAKAEK